MRAHWIEAPTGRRRGSALAVVVIMVTVMAGMACMLLTVTLGGHKEQRQEREGLHARAVAQAGISDAMHNLLRGASGVIGTPDEPVAWGRSRYFVTETNLSGSVISLQSTGIDDRNSARMELVVRSVPTTIWRFGAFGKEFMHMDSNARVDSYNSDLGTYASQAINGSGSTQHGNSNGDIGSNGDVGLDQNGKVWGDALAGPNHSTTVLGNAVVSGSIVPMPEPLELPALTLPSYASLGALTVNGATTIPTGNRRYTNLTVETNKTLTVNGPANIVITNLLLKSGSSMRINATGGPVTLWVIDDFVMRSNAFLGPTDLKSKNLAVNLLSDNVINPEVAIDLDEIDFASNTRLYGMVYAPSAAIEIRSNFELFGSLIARSVDLDSNARFHFDEALLDATGSGAPAFETICLRDLAIPDN
jgi:hypothetical protein